jgi:thioredoxin-dependent peroxiredoxin
MLPAGAEAPDFTGAVADGPPLTLSSLRGRPVLLYFYPKANSFGCSIEARGFSEHYAEFRAAGITVVGVSVDSIESQQRFAEKCTIPFPLIADRDGSIAKRYGVLGLFGLAKRVTFFIGPDGRIAEVVSGLSPGPHLRRALERVHSLPKG